MKKKVSLTSVTWCLSGPVQRTSTAWNMCTEDKIINVESYKPLRSPPPEARGQGYWDSDGVWIKVENEHGTI
eukprot:5214706-Amphidinium_carterae.1